MGGTLTLQQRAGRRHAGAHRAAGAPTPATAPGAAAAARPAPPRRAPRRARAAAPALRRGQPHQRAALRGGDARARRLELRVAEDGAEALALVRDWTPRGAGARRPPARHDRLRGAARACARCRRWRAVPAYMCSADAMPEDLQRARDAGFVGYWTKPIEHGRASAPTSTPLRQRPRAGALADARVDDRAPHRRPHDLRPEPAHRHGSPTRTAVLLVNLGTPDAPTPAALRRYLARVPERPARGRDPARAVVADPARRDPARAAGASRRTSTPASGPPEGSPLQVWTRQAGDAAARLPRRARPPGAGAPRDALRQPVGRLACSTS